MLYLQRGKCDQSFGISKNFRGTKMITDTEIKIKGIEALIAKSGEVQAERFISLIMREPFDYTKWQRNLWPDKSLEEISKAAMRSRSQKD
jgi:hypothetical protein